MWKYIVNVIDGEFGHWPRWLVVFNIGCMALGLWIIFWL